ncbi:chemerin-like receptor 1 [Amia ocellicauda]|uniref:chemerin-like receptor 1 n=1 Tax=Amia ocellicauda TaxID=2972642 RepID=UPI003464C2CF
MDPVDDYDYDYFNNDTDAGPVKTNTTSLPTGSAACTVTLHSSAFRNVIAVLYSIIFLLGFCGNGLVIWITGFKMKRTVNTTWFLSLAISDFLFCVFLPFNIVHVACDSHWYFGLLMCKFNAFILFLNMFSSIFLLVIISIDRCVTVVFPVWSQNYRTPRMASVIAFLAWVTACLLSIPSLIFRDIKTSRGKTLCYNNYENTDHESVAFSRFVFGFVIPFVVIVFCYTIIIRKLKNNRMARSNKPFKIMSAIIATFFVCWLPYHIVIMLEINHHRHDTEIFKKAFSAIVTLAFANSFLNPILYVFMGNDFKQKFKMSVLSKIENALSEDGRTTSRRLSKSSSVYDKGSTVV